MKNNELDTKMIFRISKITKEQLEQIAQKKDLTVSQIIRKLIKEYVEKNYEQSLFD